MGQIRPAFQQAVCRKVQKHQSKKQLKKQPKKQSKKRPEGDLAALDILRSPTIII
jgi:hypothetical protein